MEAVGAAAEPQPTEKQAAEEPEANAAGTAAGEAAAEPQPTENTDDLPF